VEELPLSIVECMQVYIYVGLIELNTAEPLETDRTILSFVIAKSEHYESPGSD
jgi:hypothetical protein